MLSMKVIKRINPKSFHHKEKNLFFSLILHLHEMEMLTKLTVIVS